MIISLFRKHNTISGDNEFIDTDVQREKEEVCNLMKSSHISQEAIIVQDLTKVFPNTGLVAVNKVNFHFPKGECFGLLGTNGAGKTTTFKMLTGGEVLTTGDAKIGNSLLSHGIKQFMKESGYCSELDGIIGELTGEEMLELMAGLRGVPQNMMQTRINGLITSLDLTECCKRPCSTYSGGNKRKLSTAMALVGQPPLVFLDEPTSGVDPVSRRKLWKAIRDANSNGQSVILTSHSMDECEALCSKIVIMTKGSIRCVGTKEHLKTKFGQGFTVQIKIKAALEDGTEQDYQDLKRELRSFIYFDLPGSEIMDEHRGMIVYRVPSGLPWSKVFDRLEILKGSRKFETLIEDYAAMDPTLEQVFLSFAREENNKNNL